MVSRVRPHSNRYEGDPLPQYHHHRPSRARWLVPQIPRPPGAVMNMPSIPYDLIMAILTQALCSYGIVDTLKLRLVSRLFDLEVIRLLSMPGVWDYPRSLHSYEPRVWRRICYIHLLRNMETKLLADRRFTNGLLAAPSATEALMGIEQLKWLDISVGCSEHDDFEVHLQELKEPKDTVDRCQIARLVSAVAICHLGVGRTTSSLIDSDLEKTEPLTCAEWVVLSAIFLGEVSLVTEMLGRGVFLGGETERLWHPLSMAARRGRTEIVALLLGHGADTNCGWHAYDSHSSPTALEEACSAGHLKVVRTLLDPRHGLVKSGRWYKQALLNAAFATHRDCPCRVALVTLLLENGEFSDLASTKASFMLRACEYGHDDIVLLMLEQGVSVNACQEGFRERWALPLAATKGHLSTVKLLLDRGAGNDARVLQLSFWGAFDGGYTAIVELLFDAGINVNGDGEYEGPGIFREAAQQDKLPLMLFLLDRGLDLNAHRCGAYALSRAVFEGRKEVVRFLLERGVEAVDHFEEYPDEGYLMLLAEMFKRDEVVEILVEFGYEEVEEDVVEDSRRRFLNEEIFV